MASLFSICKQISNVTPGYKFGGGHDKPISQVRGSQPLDCSSSCSRALYLAGFFGSRDWALSSGQFANWGVAGKGKTFTVWYKSTHVWIEFHPPRDGYRRFDTSPWGFGGRGPRIRKTPRSKIGFKPRHWPGH
jgi:hypothetical protein